MNSKKELVKTIKALPWDAWISQWYGIPVLPGRRMSFYFTGMIPKSKEKQYAKDALECLIDDIEDMDEDCFNGHWSISFVPAPNGVTYFAYIGGPGSQPPPNGD